MAPITASQFGTNRIFSQLILCKEEKDLGPLERLSSAAVSGAASAFIASPSELVIIHQQKTGKALVTQAKDILTKYGASAYCRGIVSAARVPNPFSLRSWRLLRYFCTGWFDSCLAGHSGSSALRPLNTSREASQTAYHKYLATSGACYRERNIICRR